MPKLSTYLDKTYDKSTVVAWMLLSIQTCLWVARQIHRKDAPPWRGASIWQDVGNDVDRD